MRSSWIRVAPKSNDKSPHKGRTGEKTQRRQQHEDRGRDRSDADTSQGMPGATGSWKGQEPEAFPEPLEGAQPCQHFDFGLPASRMVRE